MTGEGRVRAVFIGLGMVLVASIGVGAFLGANREAVAPPAPPPVAPMHAGTLAPTYPSPQAQGFAMAAPLDDLRIEGSPVMLYVSRGTNPQVALSWNPNGGNLLDALHEVEAAPPESCDVDWNAENDVTAHESWWLDRERRLLVSPRPAEWQERVLHATSWNFRCPAIGVALARGRYDVWQMFNDLGPDTTHVERLPGVYDYVYMDKLPEAIRRAPPEDPDAARGEHLAGTVLVKALVDKLGHVHRCVIVKSIPALDEAAMASVYKWQFRPASAHGKPVAVWIAVPVQFTQP